MPKVTFDTSMSLDGFIAGPNAGPGKGLGEDTAPGRGRTRPGATGPGRGGGETSRRFASPCASTAGLLDEMQIHIAPVLLGRGVRLFDDSGPDHVELEIDRVVESPALTHVRYRVRPAGR
jgi:hypothetical protein